MPEDQIDVLIVGGGAAGLSAALTLARARRQVVVIDAGNPRNAPAAAAHGLLGQEGVNPLMLLAQGHREVQSYGGRIINGQVAQAALEPGCVRVVLSDGAVLHARALIVASGVHDELPAISGLRERWGRDVVHCPYCHGWEIRDQRIGLLATGPMSALQALLFHQWSARLQFFPQGLDFSAEDLEKLEAVGIEVVHGEVIGVETKDDRLAGARMDDGRFVTLDALAVPARTAARLEGLSDLSLETTTTPMGVSLVVDAAGRTSVPGVWAAGNVVNPGFQVSEAAAQGARVAMTINTELVFQDADDAVASRRSIVEV